ncbi:MAG: DUF167 domain-containing protein [candidate division WOR-3 bacterium]
MMIIRVKVFTESKRDEIFKISENSFEIKVREKPIKGEANKKVIKILSDYFKVPESKIRIIKGFKERNKIFEIKI